jgi:hypothetical protein
MPGPQSVPEGPERVDDPRDVVESEGPRVAKSVGSAGSAGSRRRGLGVASTSAAIVLPLLALGVAAATQRRNGILTHTLTDPIPTPLHVVAILLVPLAGILAEGALKRPSPKSLRRASGFVGAATAIAVLQAIAWIPAVPLGVIATIAGVGFLVLSPHLAAFAFCFVQERVVIAATKAGVKVAGRWIAGFAMAAFVIAVIDLHRIRESAVIDLALVGEASAISELRTSGASPEAIARNARRGGSLGGPLGSLVKLPRHGRDSDLLVFRITGEFPASFRGLDESGRAPFGSGVGVELPGSVSRELRLAESRLEGDVASGPGLATFAWTLDLANEGAVQAEGRILFELPRGAFGTDLSQWIEGQERSSAFASRLRVTPSHDPIVTRHPDTARLTWFDETHLELRCFPVAPKGNMRVKVTIVAPLVIDSEGEGAFARVELPRIAAADFALDAARHSIHVDVDSAFEDDTRRAASNDAGVMDRAPLGELRVVRSGGTRFRAAMGDGSFATLDVVPTAPAVPATHVVVALDGSRALATEKRRVAALLAALGEHVPLTMFVGTDGAPVELETPEGEDALDAVSFLGGRDPVPLLAAALDRAAGIAGARVLWISGPQPFELGEFSPVIARSELAPPIVRIALDDRRSPLAEDLRRRGRLVDVTGPGRERATAVAASLGLDDASAPVLEPRTCLVTTNDSEASLEGSVILPEGSLASRALIQLATGREAMRRLASGDGADREAATRLAIEQHVVTPVSGPAGSPELRLRYDHAPFFSFR